MARAMNLPKLGQLRDFAAMLGWGPLEKHVHRFGADERNVDLPSTVVWYECRASEDLWLQINVMSALHAAVYAPRYRLCSLWHWFELGATRGDRRAAAEGLDTWLHKRWFERAEARRLYRKRHPECCGYSWRKIREIGVPHLGR
jgi:hypothetical protein